MNKITAHKAPFYPTDEQKAMLKHCFGAHRWAYNMAVFMRSVHRDVVPAGGTRPSRGAVSVALTQFKKDPDYAWLKDVSISMLQQALADANDAFTKFYDDSLANGHPNFKSKKDNRHKCRFPLDQRQVNYKFGEFVKLPKLGKCKIKWSRHLTGRPKMATVELTPSGKYFIAFSLETEINQPIKTGKSIGIDLGITRRAALSDGSFRDMTNQTKRFAPKLARAQRKLSRRTKGSSRYEKQRRCVALVHEQIANARKDALHKFSNAITNEFDLICIETLVVKNMVKNRKLAKALADASFGELVRQLEYKAENKDKTLIKINQWFASSKTCSACGSKQFMPLAVRQFECPCGHSMDRDTNAAVNILAEGYRSLGVEESTAGAGKIMHQVRPMKRCKIKLTSIVDESCQSGRLAV